MPLGVKELEGERNVPSSAEEGWLRDQENGAQHIHRADGVVLVKFNEMSFLDQHHPGRSYKVSGIFS